MHRSRFVSVLLLASWCAAAAADAPLLTRHATLAMASSQRPAGLPMHVDSHEAGDVNEGEVIGVLDAPFAAVRALALSSAAWCAVATVHPNVKACLAVARPDGCGLDVYIGRRHFQSPREAYRTQLVFLPGRADGSTLEVRLEAGEGPLGTRDYRLQLEAARLDERRTVVRLRYGYALGLRARVAIRFYFATAARDKIGFSEVDTADGPRPVRGPRGAVERNAVRYFLALRAYLESDDSRERRLERWLELRARFTRQLDAIDAGDYLAAKRRELSAARALREHTGGPDASRLGCA